MVSIGRVTRSGGAHQETVLDRLHTGAGPLGRAIRRIEHRVYKALTPLLSQTADFRSDGRLSWMRLLPRIPVRLQRYAPIPIWRDFTGTVPAELRTTAGVWRNEKVETLAYHEAPLLDFPQTHPEAVADVLAHGWNFVIPTAPLLQRSLRRLQRSTAAKPAQKRVTESPEEMNGMIRAYAESLGLSAVGFARYDPRYTFEEYADGGDDNVIVCILEQDWAATQTAPSGRAERAAFHSYAEINMRIAALADYIHTLGYRARPHNFAGEAVVIHYGVEAGLGQLGLNGQLLTPAAGSRCRVSLITTSAPVAPGEPVDYGIHGICDRCQACVRRCPVGAIPKARSEYRGVTKVKIKPERCFPVLSRNHGCAVCMKVCPVQRYGLDAVLEHFEATGEILGKGTDELEGYTWPGDGSYYPAGSKPPVNAKTVHPRGWKFDVSQVPKWAPPADQSSSVGV
jgi:epoxyqueuosine reductase